MNPAELADACLKAKRMALKTGVATAVWMIAGDPPRDTWPTFRVGAEGAGGEGLKVVSFDANGAATPAAAFREELRQ